MDEPIYSAVGTAITFPQYITTALDIRAVIIDNNTAAIVYIGSQPGQAAAGAGLLVPPYSSRTYPWPWRGARTVAISSNGATIQTSDSLQVMVSDYPSTSIFSGPMWLGSPNQIAPGVITAAKINVATLSAIQVNTGALAISDWLTIGLAGGIYQGTGTPAVPATGLKISNQGGIGLLEMWGSGAKQVYMGTDGKLYAGAGKVQLDSTGLIFNNDGSNYSYISAYNSLFPNYHAQYRTYITNTWAFISLRTDLLDAGTVASIDVASSLAASYIALNLDGGSLTLNQTDLTYFAKQANFNTMQITSSGTLSLCPSASLVPAAASGLIRIPNAQWLTSRNAGNSGDVNMIQVDGNNNLAVAAPLLIPITTGIRMLVSGANYLNLITTTADQMGLDIVPSLAGTMSSLRLFPGPAPLNATDRSSMSVFATERGNANAERMYLEAQPAGFSLVIEAVEAGTIRNFQIVRETSIGGVVTDDTTLLISGADGSVTVYKNQSMQGGYLAFTANARPANGVSGIGADNNGGNLYINVPTGLGVRQSVNGVTIVSVLGTGAYVTGVLTASGGLGQNSGQVHAIPAVASDTFALLVASQTLSNKTLASPTVTGNIVFSGAATHYIVGVASQLLMIGGDGGTTYASGVQLYGQALDGYRLNAAGSGLVRVLYSDQTRPLMVLAEPATAGTTIRNVFTRLRSSYWNGASAINREADIIHNITATTPASQLDFQVPSGSTRMSLTDGGNMIITGYTMVIGTSHTPANSSETLVAGAIAWDTNYLYVWTAASTVKRIALTAF